MADKYLVICETVREAVNVMHEFLAFTDQLKVQDKFRHHEVILKSGSSYQFIGEIEYEKRRLGFRGREINGYRLEKELDRFMNKLGEFRGLTIGDVFNTLDSKQKDRVYDILSNIVNKSGKAEKDAFSYDLSFLSNWVQMLVVRELIARTLLSVSNKGD